MSPPHDSSIKERDRVSHGDDPFFKLFGDSLRRFDSQKITKEYSKGSRLFFDGQPCEGVYLLCQGRIKLSKCSPAGKILILEIAEPGDVLGLSAAINGVEHETTAEAVEPSRITYVATDDLLGYLRSSPETCLNAARQLARKYSLANQLVCSLGLSESAVNRLARLFLDWSGNGSGVGGSVSMHNQYTHEEMAEMIGASRETVTRALKYFRENDLITQKGSNVVIHDRLRLWAVLGTAGVVSKRS